MENPVIYYDENKQSKVLVCIQNHNANENSLRLLDIFSRRFDTKVIDSGSDIKDERFLLYPNIFYGGTYNVACDLAIDGNYDWMYFICCDVCVSDEDADNVLDAIEFISKTYNVGVFTPSVRVDGYDCWKNHQNGTNTYCQTNTINGFSIMVKCDIIKKVRDIIKGNVYGWGLDMIEAVESKRNNYINVVDNKSKIFHPYGCSYSTGKANEEYQSLMKRCSCSSDLNNPEYINSNNKNVCELIKK